MSKPRKTLQVATQSRRALVDITGKVREALGQSGMADGIAVIYSPHTTAGILINENCDPDVARDTLLWMGEAVPKDHAGFRHNEGNSDSHIQTNLVGSSATVIVENGQLCLGTWQGIFLAEYDGPRHRQVWCKFIPG